MSRTCWHTGSFYWTGCLYSVDSSPQRFLSSRCSWQSSTFSLSAVRRLSWWSCPSLGHSWHSNPVSKSCISTCQTFWCQPEELRWSSFSHPFSKSLPRCQSSSQKVGLSRGELSPQSHHWTEMTSSFLSYSSGWNWKLEKSFFDSPHFWSRLQ